MSTADRSPGARRTVIVLAAVCLLAAGFVIGRFSSSSPVPPPSYLQQLTSALGLRPDQVAAVERVLGEEDRDMDALVSSGLQSVSQQTTARRSRTEQQILALLDPAQRQRYDSLVAAEAGR